MNLYRVLGWSRLSEMVKYLPGESKFMFVHVKVLGFSSIKLTIANRKVAHVLVHSHVRTMRSHAERGFWTHAGQRTLSLSQSSPFGSDQGVLK